MTPEKKKLWLYGGGAAALTLLVYFVFFNKPAAPKTPIYHPPVPPTDTEDVPEYPNKVDNGYQDVVSKPSMIVAAKSGTRLRKEPNTNSAIVKTYKAGDQFFVNEKKTMSDGDWYHLNNGSGWVRSDVVTIMNAGFGGGF